MIRVSGSMIATASRMRGAIPYKQTKIRRSPGQRSLNPRLISEAAQRDKVSKRMRRNLAPLTIR